MESSNWQTRLSTVRERTQYAFKKSLFCDVEFTVVDSANGGKVTVPGNKYMLSVSSPVFEAMFYGDLKEKQDTIDLPDCTKEGLQELLRFVHSDEVNLTGNNVMEVLYIANKYDMPFLTIKCRKYLKDCLKPDEVFTVLPQVQKMGDKEIEDFCWKVIDNKTHLAISSKPFLEIPREMLCQILNRDSLKIKELEIFQAVDKWAAKKIEEEKLECSGNSKRAILGEDVIRLIRFPLMSFQEFAEVVLPCEILEKCELTELVQIIGKVVSSTSMFSKKRRGVLEVCSKNRFIIINPPLDSWHYRDQKVDAVNFTVNKPAYLSGVQLFGSENKTYTIELEILKNDQKMSRLSSSYISEMVNYEYFGFTANLDELVSLDPNILYTVKAKILGPISYYGVSGQQDINMNDNFKITFENSDKCTNGTSIERGQFPSLIITDSSAKIMT